MAKINLYSEKGVKKDGFKLPKDFSGEINMDLISQAVRVYEDRMHPGFSKVKTRGQVKTSTRKIYRQKGTGNARHGAKSAPIFVGGGVAHGPKGVKKVLRLPKNMAKKALLSSLSLKADKGELVFVEGLKNIKKTKEAAKLLGSIEEAKKANKIYLVLSSDNSGVSKYFKNINKVNAITTFNLLNAYDVLFAGVMLCDKDIFETKTKKAVKKQTKTK